MTDNNTTKPGGSMRYLVAMAVVAGAFFGAFALAQARSGASSQSTAGASTCPMSRGASRAVGTTGSASAASGLGASASDLSAAAAGGCCGGGAAPKGGVSGDASEGAAKVEGAVQKISVDVSTGYYQPNVIKLKAGVPAEITFSGGAGCTAQVMSQDLGFFEDMSNGPVTVKVAALAAGEYSFSCGMQMVFGKIVVE